MQEGGGGDTAAAGHQAIYPPFFEEDETTVFPVGSVGEGVGARREEAAGSPHTPPIGRTESDQENSLNPQCGEASAGSAPGAFSVVVHHGSVHEQGVGSHVDPWFPAGRPDSPDAYNPKDSGSTGCFTEENSPHPKGIGTTTAVSSSVCTATSPSLLNARPHELADSASGEKLVESQGCTPQEPVSVDKHPPGRASGRSGPQATATDGVEVKRGGRRLLRAVEAEESARRADRTASQRCLFSIFLPEAWPETGAEGKLDPISDSLSCLALESEELNKSWFFGEFLVRRYVRSAREEAGCLDRLLRAMRRKDALYKSTSLRAALTRPWLWIIFFLSTVWMAKMFAVVISQRTGPSYTARAFRLVARQERSGAVSTTPGVAGWGLLWNGCRFGVFPELYDSAGLSDEAIFNNRTASDFNFNVMQEGASMTLRFNGAVTMNGWFFQALESEPQRHPVVFEIQVEDEEGGWTQIGSPARGLTDNYMIMDPVDAYTFQLKVPWQYLFLAGGITLTYSITLPVGIFFGVTKRPYLGEVVCAAGFCLQGLIAILSLIFATVIDTEDDAMRHSMTEMAISSAIYSSMTIVVIIAYFVHWRKIFAWVFLFGVAVGLSIRVKTTYIQHRPSVGVLESIEMYMHAILFMCPLAMQLIDRGMRARKWDHIKTAGLTRWSRAWSNIVSSERAALIKLKFLCDDVFHPRSTARQCNRSKGTSERPRLHMTPFESVVVQHQGIGVPGKVDTQKPIKSLDQLFAQAEGLQRFLATKSRVWAHECGGYFPGANGGLVKWSEATKWTDVAEQRPKLPQRCVQKVLRAYHGDVSYLLDICRVLIVFGTVADLTKCLETIMKDPEVVVVRIKNYLDLTNDGGETAGYRNVIINLRLDVDLTRLLGLEIHVSEIQLVLREYYLEPTSHEAIEQHQGYLRLRDLRAERPMWRRVNIARHVRKLTKKLKRILWGPDYPPSRRMDVEMGSGMMSDGTTNVVSLAWSMMRLRSQTKISPSIVSVSLPREEGARSHRDSLNSDGGGSGAHLLLRRVSEMGGFEGPYRNSLKGMFSSSVRDAGRGMLYGDIGEAGDGQGLQEDQVSNNRLWQRFFVSQYLNNTLDVGAFMEKKMNKVSTAMAAASGASAFFTSTPIASAMTKRWFRAVILFVAFFFVYSIVNGVLTQDTRYKSKEKGRIFRFTALETRSNQPSVHPGINSFGIVMDGCAILSDEAELTRNERHITLAYKKLITMNGFWISTALHEPESDPKRFMIEAKLDPTDEVEEWHIVGASGWAIFAGGWSLHRPDIPFDLPLQRNVTTIFDHRPPFFAEFFAIFADALFALTTLIMSCMALADHYESQSKVLAAAYMLSVLSFFYVAVASSYWNKHPTISASAWCLVVINSYASAGIWLAEHMIIRTIFVVGVMYCAMSVLVAFVDTYDSQLITGNVNYVGIFFMSLSTFIAVYRKFTLKFASDLVREDLAAYEESWNSAISNPENLAAIDRLRGVCEACPIVKSTARQYNRLSAHVDSDCSASWRSRSLSDTFQRVMSGSSDHRQGSGADRRVEGAENADDVWSQLVSKEPWLNHGLYNEDIDGLIDGCRGTLDLASPVCSIDQLFAQAAGLDTVLLRCAQTWALASGGYFFRHGGGLVRWKEAATNIELARTIKWGTIKNPTRAIEKLTRAYHGEVSHLLDICRQSIVFETVEELTTCLSAIIADPCVIVVRIKNRIDLSYDGKETAGYRDVSVNLRLDNAMSRDLGVETHVCELKLLLSTFANLKSDKGHGNYVQWRNMRGE